ncbi:transposase, partial [Aliifodinibius sp. S!AR15-10]|nr:transposase [Aliifodinibius sp. S!AR15-10]
MPLDQQVPDFSTFWRFRQALATEELVEELFAEITRQLEALLSGDERAIFGDKAYPSKELKTRCRREGTYYGILDKAY